MEFEAVLKERDENKFYVKVTTFLNGRGAGACGVRVLTHAHPCAFKEWMFHVES